jgi:hypothetical protein
MSLNKSEITKSEINDAKKLFQNRLAKPDEE